MHIHVGIYIWLSCRFTYMAVMSVLIWLNDDVIHDGKMCGIADGWNGWKDMSLYTWNFEWKHFERLFISREALMNEPTPLNWCSHTCIHSLVYLRTHSALLAVEYPSAVGHNKDESVYAIIRRQRRDDGPRTKCTKHLYARWVFGVEKYTLTHTRYTYIVSHLTIY